jgi:molecular chaperone DnaK (HSP70)
LPAIIAFVFVIYQHHHHHHHLPSQVNPDEAVAYGAAVQAGLLAGSSYDIVAAGRFKTNFWFDLPRCCNAGVLTTSPPQAATTSFSWMSLLSLWALKQQES